MALFDPGPERLDELVVRGFLGPCPTDIFLVGVLIFFCGGCWLGKWEELLVAFDPAGGGVVGLAALADVVVFVLEVVRKTSEGELTTILAAFSSSE